MWTVWAALALTLVASVTDIRERRIPNWLTYPFMALGTLNVLLHPALLPFALLGILLSYALYRLGVWAGGDAKLFFALSLLLPDPLKGLSLYAWVLLLSVLLGGGTAVAYALFRLARDPALRGVVRKSAPTVLLRGFSLGVALTYLGAPGVVFSILPHPVYAFSALALFLSAPLIDSVLAGVYASLAALFFYLLSLRSLVFSREVPVDLLRPGDVPAEIVTERGKRIPLTLGNALLALSGRIRPLVSPFRAAGLEGEDIERLRRLGISALRVRRTVPFVPFVLLALSVLIISMHLGLWT